MRRRLGTRCAVSYYTITFTPSGACLSNNTQQHHLFSVISHSMIPFPCIGCCCDSKRAVLIYNIFNIIFAVIYIITLVVYNSAVAGYIFGFFGIIIYFLTIAGSTSYSKGLVSLGALWAVVKIILAIVFTVQGRSLFTVVVNGRVYNNPYANIIGTLIWEGLVLYVSFFCLQILFPP